MAKKLVDEKQRIISKYVELRKTSPHEYPTYVSFRNKTGVSREKVERLFGGYKEFAVEAETKFRDSLPKAQRALLAEKQKKYDFDVTQEMCIEDLRRVQEASPLSFISRTHYRNEGKYSDATWNQYFGTFHEFRRQAGLELTRHQHALEKHIAKQVANDHYNQWFVSEILPFMNKYVKEPLPGKIKTMMICSDLHDEEVDEFTLEVFINACRICQPDVIVFNGDIFDLYEFGKYAQDLRKVNIKERFDFVRERVFKPLREACPNAQMDFIMGNHEFRLLRLLADQTPNIRVLLSDVLGLSFSKIFGLDEFQINWVSKLDLGVFTKSDITDELKKNYRIYYDCYVVTHEPTDRFEMSGTNGHHHKAHLSSRNNYLRGHTTWVQTPGMHVADAEYLKGMAPWNTGFLKVYVNTETKQVIQNIIQTHSWCVVDGIFYERKK